MKDNMHMSCKCLFPVKIGLLLHISSCYNYKLLDIEDTSASHMHDTVISSEAPDGTIQMTPLMTLGL